MKEVKLWALEKDQNKNLVPVPVDTLDQTETEKEKLSERILNDLET